MQGRRRAVKSPQITAQKSHTLVRPMNCRDSGVSHSFPTNCQQHFDKSATRSLPRPRGRKGGGRKADADGKRSLFRIHAGPRDKARQGATLLALPSAARPPQVPTHGRIAIEFQQIFEFDCRASLWGPLSLTRTLPVRVCETADPPRRAGKMRMVQCDARAVEIAPVPAFRVRRRHLGCSALTCQELLRVFQFSENAFILASTFFFHGTEGRYCTSPFSRSTTTG